MGNVFDAFRCAIFSSSVPTQVSITHNTFISGAGLAVRLSDWATGTNLVFANNACYSQSGAAINMVGPSGTAVFAGLVTFGSVTPGLPVAAIGTGLGDFTNVSWNATNRDVSPSATSPLRGAGAAAHAAEYDVHFYLRTAPHTTGCHR